MADHGTIFLDEIGELTQSIQIKLLRVIQEKEFERVGGEETIKVDVRIIAATNKDLKTEVDKGNFREDLYYRLNVVTINVPPLRERKEDIPLLINHFIHEFNEENNKQISGIHPNAKAILYSYNWPGNIRELRNCIESAVVLTKSELIMPEDLPDNIVESESENYIKIPIPTTLKEAERKIIFSTLKNSAGNKSKAAKALEIGRKTFHRKLAEYAAESAEYAAESAEYAAESAEYAAESAETTSTDTSQKPTE
jgi:transcriptional regulator with PAS, ATPase and Fis domain